MAEYNKGKASAKFTIQLMPMKVHASGVDVLHVPYSGSAPLMTDKTPELIARLAQAGAEDGGGSAERLAEFMRSEQAKFAKVIKDAGISVQG